MNLDNRILKGGWGVYFLSLYTLGIIHLHFPAQHNLKVFAVTPALGVMFLSNRLNEKLIFFFAGGSLGKSMEEIDQMVGDDHYYESLDEQSQARIDEYDHKSYRKNNTILSGILIGITAPFVGFWFFSIHGFIVGGIITILSYRLLFVDSIRELNELARNLVEVYRSFYESQ